jgi:predicted AlkP superfamily phosphohydrolase/phosphomutase
MTETKLKSEKLKSRIALLWRGIFLLCAAALFLSIFIVSVKINPARADGNRVIMLGFDGMDYNLTLKYMDQGDLPNFSRLEEMGIISPLLSTFPPESPVAWSAMITGTNPGKTGIFDFLRRNPETYFPELNMTNTIKPIEFLFDTIPTGLPVLENARQGDPLWVYAANSGVNTVGIMMPMNMPPDEAPGSRVLSGLGVPDAAKTMGTYIFYVDDIEVARARTGSTGGTEMGGMVLEVEREGNEATTILPGPFDPVHPGSGEKISVPVTMTIDPAGGTVDFRLENQTPFKFMIFFGGLIITLIICLILWPIIGRRLKGAGAGFRISLAIFLIAIAILGLISRPTVSIDSHQLSEGQWSDWIPVKFLITDWVGMEGFCRAYLIEADPEFQLYVSPVSIDPRGTMANISYPGSYAKDLLNEYGDFKTYGWDSETWAFNENVITEEMYLNDLFENWDNKAEMVFDQMDRDDWQLFTTVFQGTDHVSHMFWRLIDETHPMYDAELADLYGDSILCVYQRADDLVGRVLDEIMREGDNLIVMSDHGFQTWHKSVNLNTWLEDNGYLARKRSLLSNIMPEDVGGLFDPNNEFFMWVDWSDSQAYALGLGQIYINLEGRESEGIVTEAERSNLIDEIIAGLLEMEDPETGDRLLVNAYRGDDLYHGDNLEYAPDIVVGFAPGYRVSWQTTLGVSADQLVEPNMKKWSGDHCSFDRTACLGILLSTVPITVDDPELIDLTPSMLSLLGIDKPARCDGRVIF